MTAACCSAATATRSSLLQGVRAGVIRFERQRLLDFLYCQRQRGCLRFGSLEALCSRGQQLLRLLMTSDRGVSLFLLPDGLFHPLAQNRELRLIGAQALGELDQLLRTLQVALLEQRLRRRLLRLEIAHQRLGGVASGNRLIEPMTRVLHALIGRRELLCGDQESACGWEISSSQAVVELRKPEVHFGGVTRRRLSLIDSFPELSKFRCLGVDLGRGREQFQRRLEPLLVDGGPRLR